MDGPVVFHKRRIFAWKTIILAIVTIAFVPVMLYQSDAGARYYVIGLIVVHIISIFTFFYGVSKEDIAPTKGGLAGRIIGLVVAFLLLGLAEKGVRTQDGVATAIFWWSLFAIWAIHTAGLALLHLRGKKEQACIFAASSESDSQ